MKKHILFFLFICSISYSQKIVSEFPIDVKHKVLSNKKSEKKWITPHTSNYLDQFDSQLYEVDEKHKILYIKKNKLAILYTLDQNYNIIDSKEFKGYKRLFPKIIYIENGVINMFYQERFQELISKNNPLVLYQYHIKDNDITRPKLDTKLQEKSALCLFELNDKIYALSKNKKNSSLILYSFNISTGFVKQNNIPIDKGLKKINELAVIKKQSLNKFSKNSAELKVYLNSKQNSFKISIDIDTIGTRLYDISLSNFKINDRKIYKYDYNLNTKNNSLLFDNNLYQIALSKKYIFLKIHELKSKAIKEYSFFEKDPIFYDNNTQYGRTNLFISNQKEVNHNSMYDFLIYAYKGKPSISISEHNNSLNILLGSRRTIVKTAGGTINMGTDMTFIESSFNNYTYLNIDKENNINKKLNLTEFKKSQIKKGVDSILHNKNYKMVFQSSDKRIITYYDAINRLYKIVKLN